MDTIWIRISLVDPVYEWLLQSDDEKVAVEHLVLLMAGHVVITPKG